MKTYYYYASHEMQRFDEPLAQPEKVCNCTLTEQMLKWVVTQCASGVPPFKVIIPRYVAWEFSTWNVPENLLTVKIVEGKPLDDISPFDTARIIFDDCEAHIICRRVIPVLSELWDCGVVNT